MNLFQEYFIDVIKNKYADFEGRATRSEYWYFVLFYMVVLFGLLLLTLILPDALKMLTGVMMAILALGLIIPSLALAVRRLHDTGKSGWWYLISFIPLGGFVLLVFYCTDSDPGVNQWGPNPKEIGPGDNVTGQLIEDDMV